MRMFFYLLFFVLVFLFGSKIFKLLISGELFESGALKKSLRESGKTLWWGMKMFVIVWLLYLIFIWWVRNR